MRILHIPSGQFCRYIANPYNSAIACGSNNEQWASDITKECWKTLWSKKYTAIFDTEYKGSTIVYGDHVFKQELNKGWNISPDEFELVE